MASLIHFETPENVEIAYRPAGLGTRFTAWVIDEIFVILLLILVGILAIALAAAAGVVAENVRQTLGEPRPGASVSLYVLAIGYLLWALSSFLYFALSELLWRGQTIGKHYFRLRVVKTDGFALDAGSVLIRNIFRVVDQLAVLWIVPLVSPRSQRFGDMAAGTVVVSEMADPLSNLRTQLLAIPAADSKFRFDGTMLSRASRSDVEAVERILERWPSLNSAQKTELLARVVDPIARRLGCPSPEVADRHEFLENFLAATYRRDARRLG
jgi:uncharacterized RDD family membrane protein YckC